MFFSGTFKSRYNLQTRRFDLLQTIKIRSFDQINKTSRVCKPGIQTLSLVDLFKRIFKASIVEPSRAQVTQLARLTVSWRQVLYGSEW